MKIRHAALPVRRKVRGLTKVLLRGAGPETTPIVQIGLSKRCAGLEPTQCVERMN